MAWGEASRFGYPHPPAAFAGGRIALYPIGAWAPSAFFRDSATGQWLVDFDATHMPISRAGQRSNYGGGQGMGVLATSSNKEAAFEFVKFLASEEVQSVSGRDLGQFPSGGASPCPTPLSSQASPPTTRPSTWKRLPMLAPTRKCPTGPRCLT